MSIYGEELDEVESAHADKLLDLPALNPDFSFIYNQGPEWRSAYYV